MNKDSLFRRAIEYITDALAVISGTLLSVMAIMICIAVIMRYWFNVSVGWATEVEEYILYIAVVLAAPWVLKHDKHVNVDAVINMLSPKGKIMVGILTNAIGVLIGIVLLYYGSLTTYENYVTGVLLTKIMPMPKYIPLLFIPIMSTFVTFQFLFKVWDGIQDVKHHAWEKVQQEVIENSGI